MKYAWCAWAGVSLCLASTLACVERVADTGSQLRPNVVFVSARDGNSEIYCARIDGLAMTTPVRLTQDDARDTAPCWSPDGGRIAFSSDRTGKSQIYTMGPAGEDLAQLTTVNGQAGHPCWSRSGDWIAFDVRSPEGGEYAVYRMNSDGTNQEQIVWFSSLEPSWAPDGKRLAVRNGGNLGGIQIYGLDGEQLWAPSPDAALAFIFGSLPKWSPGGDQIMYTQNLYGEEGAPKTQVLLMDVATRVTTPVIGPAGTDIGLAWSPDGSKILFASNRSPDNDLYLYSLESGEVSVLPGSRLSGFAASWCE